MKLSQITIDSVKQYVRITDSADDLLVAAIMEAATSKILHYTGLTAESVDDYPELFCAYMALCSDMYNVRDATVESDKINPTVKCILDMLSVNGAYGGDAVG